MLDYNVSISHNISLSTIYILNRRELQGEGVTAALQLVGPHVRVSFNGSTSNERHEVE